MENFEGTLALQGPARVLLWSELVNFFLDLETTDKLKFTAWFEVNPTLGSRGILLENLPPPPFLIRVN